jgi:hypothetical protein
MHTRSMYHAKRNVIHIPYNVSVLAFTRADSVCSKRANFECIQHCALYCTACMHAPQVHKIAILDIRLLNGDRNDANLLVRRLPSSSSSNSNSSSSGSHNGHHHHSNSYSNSHSSSHHSNSHHSNGDSSNGHGNGSSKQVRVWCTRYCSADVQRDSGVAMLCGHLYAVLVLL